MSVGENCKESKMKSLILLCLLFVSTNTFSLDASRDVILGSQSRTIENSDGRVSLREYLESLPKPHPLFINTRGEVNDGEFCDAVCPHPKSIDETSKKKCESGKWSPNYEAKGNCNCLTEYKCCDGICPKVNPDSCFGKDNASKGLQWGNLVKDCCGCDAIKCIACEPPVPREGACPKGGGARPKNCYTYVENDHYANDMTKCFQSQCTENPSDAPPDETCDKNCQVEVERMSSCQFPYKVCKVGREKSDCPENNKQDAIAKLDKSILCYQEPYQVVDSDGGHYYDKILKKCSECTKWEFPLKSCEAKNKIAADEDCHQYGSNELDKKCFSKVVTADECGCKEARCQQSSGEEQLVFDSDDVCPKDHTKIEGVSLCMKARDVCKKCPPILDIKEKDCQHGMIINSIDCMGCPVKRCQTPTMPRDPCPSSLFILDKDTNQLTCLSAMTSANQKSCREDHPCDIHGYSYYWCNTVDGSWDYCCAPGQTCGSDGTCKSGSVRANCISKASGMVETAFDGGTAGSSGDWSLSYPKEDTFRQNPKGVGGWTSAKNQSPPHYIWYNFKRPLLPAKISFLPRKTNVGNANIVRVKRFQFISTDDSSCSKNSNWKVLCEGESPPYQSLNDERGCTVSNKGNRQSFRCLGLRSLEPSYGTVGEVSLRGIRIWMYQ